jgi:hypothetical protein
MLSSKVVQALDIRTSHVVQVCTNWSETWTWDEVPQLLLSGYLETQNPWEYEERRLSCLN